MRKGNFSGGGKLLQREGGKLLQRGREKGICRGRDFLWRVWTVIFLEGDILEADVYREG